MSTLLPPFLETLIVPRARDIGGFEVRRALPAAGRRMVGPFVFLDQMGPAEFITGEGLDVRPHPHIGSPPSPISTRARSGTGTAWGPTSRSGPGRQLDDRRARHRPFGAHRAGGPRERRIALRHPVVGRAAEEPRGHRARLRPRAQGGPADHRGRRQAHPPRGRRTLRRPLAGRDRLGDDLCRRAPRSGRPPAGGRHPRGARDLHALRNPRHRGRAFRARPPAGLPARDAITVTAETAARFLLLGGATMDGPRHVWWNFVSSDLDKIEEAKARWAAGGFGAVPGESEFIPLPDR